LSSWSRPFAPELAARLEGVAEPCGDESVAERWLADLRAEAVGILYERWPFVAALAAALVGRRYLDADQIQGIIAATSGEVQRAGVSKQKKSSTGC
jgi:hypothetical protein